MPSQKSPKKRPSNFQAGPAPKKVHVEKSSSGRGDVASHGKKRRSRPVTLLEKDSASEVEEDGEEEGDDLIDEEAEEEVTEMDTGAVPSKDPNASRESHKVQRVLHEQRRAAKPHSTLLSDAKRVWSLAQQKNLKSSERQTHIHKLMDVIRGKVKDIVFKHDASRIVQTVVKYGGEKDRNEVAEELKGRYKDLAQNKYSKFLVTKLIRLCPKHRASIFLEFQSHVMRLLLHREASSVLADAFELHANAYERTILLRDFYGKETALFSPVTSDEDKERAKKGLKGVLEGLEGERRKRVLASVKENLVTIFNNSDKGAVTHAIVHRALWEYLVATNECSDEAEREKLWREIFECCQDVLAEMVHTKDGSRVVREFIARGNAKDRKQIVKVLKPHVIRMCSDEEAQLVLFTALDTIDDTKLTAKSIVQEITSNSRSLYNSPQGRRSLLYPLVPRTKRHFTPSQISILADTDDLRAKTSKKDDALRASEVKLAASEGLLAFMSEMGSDVARDTGGSLIITEVMLYAEGNKTVAMDALFKPLTRPYPAEDASYPHPIDLPHTSRMYKTLLQGGHFSKEGNCILPSSFSASTFASAFLKTVGRETTVEIAKGNGSFVVAELCGRIIEEGSVEEKKTLNSWFGKAVKSDIGESQGKGKRVLLEKLNELDQSCVA